MNTFRFPVIVEEKTGKKLRETRRRNGMTVPSVCASLGGITEQAVYKWERGACLPSIDNLLALSHLYHVQMEELLVYEEADAASSFLSALSCFAEIVKSHNPVVSLSGIV